MESRLSALERRASEQEKVLAELQADIKELLREIKKSQNLSKVGEKSVNDEEKKVQQ